MVGRYGLAFLMTAVLLCAAPLAAETPAPAVIVDAIYKGGNSTGRAFGLDAKERHQYFSKATAELWDKADAVSNPNGDEIGAVDFDITTNSQGAEIRSYSIVSDRIEGKTATVVVKLTLDNWIRHSPEDDLIRYLFVLEDGSWRIDDVAGASDGKPWTLRELLDINSRDHTRAKE
jgi:hypothetical protein